MSRIVVCAFSIMLPFLLAASLANTAQAAPEITLDLSPAWEYGMVTAWPVIKTDGPLAILGIERMQYTPSSQNFFNSLSRIPVCTLRLTEPVETAARLKPVAGQRDGEHEYALLIFPGQPWREEYGTLSFPVGKAQQFAASLAVSYLLPSKEQIAARAVIAENGAYRRAADYDDAAAAATRGAVVRLYLGQYPDYIYRSSMLGFAHTTAAPDGKLLVQEQQIPLTITVKTRLNVPTADEVTRREGQEPLWFYEGAWVLSSLDGTAVLMQNNKKTAYHGVEPSFFATPASTDARIPIYLDNSYPTREAYQQAQQDFHKQHPELPTVIDGDVLYLNLPNAMTLRELLDYSRRFDKTEFTLANYYGHGIGLRSQPLKAPIDPAVVRAKIKALGLRDDTVSSSEYPENWLRIRVKRILPELIAGLDSPTARIAEGCLIILQTVSPQDKLKPALVRIAGDNNHPTNKLATLALVRFAEDAVVRKLLAAGAKDAKRFPKAEDRATLAAAGGLPAEAVALLAPLLKQEYEHEVVQTINRMVAIGHPSAIPPLEAVTKSHRWSIAGAAYLALEKLDPKGHALTENQRLFIANTGRHFKATIEMYNQLRQELAALNEAEVRPFALQMLECGDVQDDALAVLAIWRSREALPVIRRLLEVKTLSYRDSNVVAAYLAIDESDRAADDVLAKLPTDRYEEPGYLIRGIVYAPIPNERKLKLLQRVSEKLRKTRPWDVPSCLMRAEDDIFPLAAPLMAAEKDIQALGAYAQLARRDTRRRYAEPLRQAVRWLTETGEKQDSSTVAILEAAATYQLQGIGAELDILFNSTEPLVKSAAARAMAACGHRRTDALALLYRELGEKDIERRIRAAQHLAALPPADAAERQAREAELLTHLGTPTEDYALRLLAGCGGAQTVRALEPLLDGEDVPRAVYAAWVLAQLPDERIKAKALRRLALYGVFHQFIAQASDGIQFGIAPDLYFTQTTGYLNHPSKYARVEQPVQIPIELLTPKTLDASEQAFAIRAYRHTILDVQTTDIPSTHFHHNSRLDASYVPLLEVIAREDPYLDALHVQGVKIAGFPYRKRAAEQIAQLTKKAATYVGFGGEMLAGDKMPVKPYPEQNLRIARFALTRITQLLAAGEPPPADGPLQYVNWARVSACDTLLRRLKDTFGEELKAVVKDEADRQKLTAQLVKCRLEWWR